MNHDIESRLKRDALLVEREAPERIVSELRARLERERAPEPVAFGSRTGGLLAAAAILVAVGGLVWALSALGRHDGADGTPTDIVRGPEQGPARGGLAGIALPGPAQGLAFASRAGEPLTAEWESMKSDSRALLRGFERRIPRLAPRD
jgi:hypothetical protein